MEDSFEKLLNGYRNTTLIKKAFEFAKEKHAGQFRKSGEPFIVHPFRVAMELKKWDMDEVVVSAGLLHDLIEDVQVNENKIKELFGEEIASLVSSLTKIKQIVPDISREVENLRRLIIAMSKDIRVIIIRLADKLDNMRTIEFLPPESQIKFSKAVLEVYAPIAHRIGMNIVKNELEDRAFRILKKEKYEELKKYIEKMHPHSTKIIKEVEERIVEELQRRKINFLKVKGRIKSPLSVFRKFTKRKVPLEEIQDIVAVRIITEDISDCYKVLAVLHEIYEPLPQTFTDYISFPKINMYQSIHTTCKVSNDIVEFQIRTEEMHRTAELGVAAHWRYKTEEGIPAKGLREWLSSFYEWQMEKISKEEFVKNLKTQLSYDEIYVLTPKGDVKRLIQGATVLDFAYAVHTDIGNHFKGALVNEKMVPISYVLKSGEKVKILTHPQAHPTLDWLKIAHTPQARYKIRKYLKEVGKIK